MRILLVTSSYLPNLGGLQTVTGKLAVELERRGHEVMVVTHRYPRSLPASEVIEGILVLRWMFLYPRWRQITAGRIDLALAGLFFFPLTLIRLMRLLSQYEPDIVNLHFLGAPALFLLPARKLQPFPFVVSLHGDDVEGLQRGTRLDHWVFRSTLDRADAVTSCSRYLLDQILADHPNLAAKSKVIHNGVESRPEEQNSSVNGSIVSIGRLMPKKGFDVLLRAMAHLASSGMPVMLKLIGDGPERDRLIALAHELKLNGTVKFCGPQAPLDVIREIQSSHLVVIPSRQEPFGMVALEAMSEGRPVVASRVGGLPELLEGADAKLVEPDNPASLARAIADVLDKTENDPEFGHRNRDLAARFSVTRMVDGYCDTYLGAVANCD